MTQVEGALAGRTMVITADRRKGDLAAALERHGAHTIHAPAVSTISHLDDAQLIDDSRALIADPPDIVVVTTGIGFRSWLEAADAAGISDDFLACMRGARLIARGPKARGAIQGAGLVTHWMAESEQAAEIQEYLLAEGVAGRRIAVQHHGTGSDGLDQAFEAAGATVQPLLIYGSGPPLDPDLHLEHIRLAATGDVDAVLFASPPGALSWLAGVREAGVFDQIAQRVGTGELLLATVGPVTSAALEQAGLATRHPERWRLGALVRDLVQYYSEMPRP